jgi:hypothetical protein
MDTRFGRESVSGTHMPHELTVVFKKATPAVSSGTPRVNLTAINPQIEIVVRGGDATHPNARTLQNAYDLDPTYADVIGISVLFRVGATLDELMRGGHFRHPKISYSPVGRIRSELALVGMSWCCMSHPISRIVYPIITRSRSPSLASCSRRLQTWWRKPCCVHLRCEINTTARRQADG